MATTTVRRGTDGHFKPGTKPGPGRMPASLPAAARPFVRLAREVSWLARDLGAVRLRLVELEAAARGLETKVRALGE